MFSHRVVAVIVNHALSVKPGRCTVASTHPSNALKRIRVSYRINAESAVPSCSIRLALRGRPSRLDKLGSNKGQCVALTLDDGSDIFKCASETLRRDGLTSANLKASGVSPTPGVLRFECHNGDSEP